MRPLILTVTCFCCVLVPLWALQNELPLAFISQRTRTKRGSHTVELQLMASTEASGLYRPFCEYAFEKLQESGLFIPTNDIPVDLQGNQAPAKGMPEGSVVKMETKALTPSSSDAVSYARYALLETILPHNDTEESEISTSGIQVMNLVVFPSNKTSLPVWGVDLVSLPGNKHLLAMDVQPMTCAETEFLNAYNSKWKEWYDTHAQQFEWGGDLPPDATKFFSPFALWTRQTGPDAVDIIQNQVFDAFCDHLDLYLQMLQDYKSTAATQEEACSNHQDEYLAYRLENDPARPMLQSLYGPEWTEEVLARVLFPSEM